MKVSDLKRYLEHEPDDAEIRVTAFENNLTNKEATAIQSYMYTNPSHDKNDPGVIHAVWIK